MDSCLQKVGVPFHRQELLLGSGSFARDLAFTFKWGHVTESVEYGPGPETSPLTSMTFLSFHLLTNMTLVNCYLVHHFSPRI